MRWKLVSLAPFFALVLRAQTFIHMSDLQFGVYTKDQGSSSKKRTGVSQSPGLTAGGPRASVGNACPH
jgi:hypothetical protein